MKPTTLIRLRDYQEECIQTVLDGRDKGLSRMAVQLPTGTGKSIIQATLIERLLADGQAALVVPFDHLVDNALRNLHLLFDDFDLGIVKAKRNEYDKRVNILSVQTATRENRMAPLRKRYKLLIVDEMHYFLSKKWRAVLDELVADDGIIIGFSATILRSDRQSLAAVFGQLVYQKPLWEMIAKGWLAPLKGVRLDAQIDLDSVKQTAGDFDDNALASILSTEQCLELLYDGWQQQAKDRITIAFTPTIKMAVECAQYWTERGVSADWVCGAGEILPQKEMERKIEAFETGKTQILFNSAKLVVGFDHPPIGCVYIIRPTRSQTWYIQMAGRGTRLCAPDVYAQCIGPLKDRVLPQKDDCLILDVGGATELGLVQFPDLFDLPAHLADQVKEKIAENPQQPWGSDDLFNEFGELYRAKGLVASRVDLIGESKYSWTRVGAGWTLSMGQLGDIKLEAVSGGFIIRETLREELDAGELDATDPASGHSITTGTKTVTVTKRKIGDNAEDASASVTKYLRRTETLLQVQPIQLEWAMALAEDRVKSRVKGNSSAAKLIDKAAPWRQEPLSEKQFYLLTKHAIQEPDVLPLLRCADYFEYLRTTPDDQKLTKGRAGEIFENVKARWDRQKRPARR